MVRSDTDDDKGTVPPKLTRKVWTVGSIPATDKDFLGWCEYQTQKQGTLRMMKLYVQQKNIESKMLYERQLKEQKDQLLSTNLVDAIPTTEPSGTNTPDGTDGSTLPPDSQNISDPQSPEHSAPLILEPPSQISPTLPLPTLLPPTAPRAEHQQGEQRAGAEPNANRLTTEEALELFALMQARRAAEAERPPTIEAQQVEVAPRRAEPLSFVTLQTVEGIVGIVDFCTTQGQTSWESKMEKFVSLGHAYSSVNIVVKI
jgi:hypothetical protein